MKKRLGIFAAVLVAAFALGAAAEARRGVPIEMVISLEDLKKRHAENRDLVLFDLRGAVPYRESHIQGALLPPSSKATGYEATLASYLQRWPKDKTIVAYCEAGCQASAVFVLLVRRLGYRNAKDMEEGFTAWKRKGYPVES